MYNNATKQALIDLLKDMEVKTINCYELMEIVSTSNIPNSIGLTLQDLYTICNFTKVKVLRGVKEEINMQLKEGKKVRISIVIDRRAAKGMAREMPHRIVKGEIIQKTKEFIVIKSKNYNECFDIRGFICKDYTILEA